MTVLTSELETVSTSNINFDDYEKEINKQTLDSEFEKALNQYYEKHNIPSNIKIGTKITGRVQDKNRKFLTVDFMGKSPVTVNNTGNEKLIIDNLEIGQKVSLFITDIIDSSNFRYMGSLASFQEYEMSSHLYDAFIDKTVLSAHIIDMNHAGYNVSVNINNKETLLFMPHLVTDVNKLADPASILNTDIDVLVDYYSKDNKKSFIASRKKYLYTLIPQAIKELKKGGSYDGIVTGSTSFAVFVQFNTCLTGMIHKTNLTEKAQSMLPNIPAGTTIGFFVKDIMKDNKLFLTQELKETLWDTIAPKQYFSGNVVAIKDYGVMISLDYETKGLLHKSMINKPLTEYIIGEIVHVQVSQVNKSARQITLALQK